MTNENLEKNKEVVIRFNKEVIEQGNLDTFRQLMDNNFINRTATLAAPQSGTFHTCDR
jgi:hypothetical protein